MVLLLFYFGLIWIGLHRTSATIYWEHLVRLCMWVRMCLLLFSSFFLYRVLSINACIGPKYIECVLILLSQQRKTKSAQSVHQIKYSVGCFFSNEKKMERKKKAIKQSYFMHMYIEKGTNEMRAKDEEKKIERKRERTQCVNTYID